jgi:hypothetical protein
VKTLRKRLGTLLVEQGSISVEQLHRALAWQSTRGARLGTALLALDSASEAQILRALQEQTGLEGVHGSELVEIPPEVLRLVPAKLALRHGLVPFRSAGPRLRVAIKDAVNLGVEDELAFVTGKRVQLLVAAEVRIEDALQRFYGRTPSTGMREAIQAIQANGLTEPADVTRPVEALGDSVANPYEEPATRRSGPQALAVRPSPAPLSRPSPPPPAAPPAMPKRLIVNLRPEERARLRVDSPSGAATGKLERETIAADLVTEARKFLDRVLLFRAHSDFVEGWLGAGSYATRELAEFRERLAEIPLFLGLRAGSRFFLGSLGGLEPHRRLARIWGGEFPRESIALPLRIGGRLTAVLYGDCGARGLGHVSITDLERMTAQAVERLASCIVRGKLKPS